MLQRELTTVVRRVFTHLHTHAVEITPYLLETGSEDAEEVAAFEAEQEDDDLLATDAVGGVPAVFVVDLRGRLLGDHAVHGRVVEDVERDKAFGDEAEREGQSCSG